MSTARCLAFGDHDAGPWGVAWMPGEGDEVSVAAGAAGADTAVRRAALEADGPDEPWRLSGEGLELSISASGEPASIDGAAPGLQGYDQSARASGSLTLAGTKHAVDSLAWRAELDGVPSVEELLSLRLLCAWFPPGDGLALVALRPRDARGQEGDLVAATVFEPDRALAVSDPRLSTTYAASGIPVRAGVELWVTADPVQEGAEPEERPHRASGEALGPREAWTEGQLALDAQQFRWHTHGREGAGVYLLGQV